MHPYSTHIPLLLRALEHTDGPILELGVGWYSTPLVHAFACAGRYARSYEVHADWHRQFAHFTDGINHDVWHVPNYDVARVDDVRWSVVFIDHDIPRRLPDLLRVRPYANYILVHDTDQTSYSLEETLATFRFRHHDPRLPRTSIVSDLLPLDWLDNARSTEAAAVSAFLHTTNVTGTIEVGGIRFTKERIARELRTGD